MSAGIGGQGLSKTIARGIGSIGIVAISGVNSNHHLIVKLNRFTALQSTQFPKKLTAAEGGVREGAFNTSTAPLKVAELPWWEVKELNVVNGYGACIGDTNFIANDFANG